MLDFQLHNVSVERGKNNTRYGRFVENEQGSQGHPVALNVSLVRCTWVDWRIGDEMGEDLNGSIKISAFVLRYDWGVWIDFFRLVPPK